MKRRFGPSDWLLVGGGLLMFIASVLPWWEVSWDGQAPQATFNAFDYTATGTLPLVLFLAVAVLIVIIKTESLALPTWLVDPVPIASAIGLGSVLVAIRFVWSGFDDMQGVSRGIGLYLAGVAVLLCIAGCVLSFRERRAAEAAGDDDELDDDELEDAFDDDDVEDDDDRGYDAGDDLIARYTAPAGETPPDPGSPPQQRRPPTRGEPRPRRRRDSSTSGPPRARRRPASPPGPLTGP